MRTVLIILALIGPSLSTDAQQTPITEEARELLNQFEDTLTTLSIYMFAQDSPEVRFVAVENFIPMLVRAMKVTNSFYYPFEELAGVSILYAPDSTFRVMTWQLEVTKGDYRYYGVVQKNSPDLQLVPLIDRSFAIEDPQFTSTSNEHWFGCFYYDIQKFENAAGERYYLLFGYDGHNFFNRKRILEVLQFEGDQLKLGLPIFHHGDTSGGNVATKSRIIVEYKSDAFVNLDYFPERGQIIFDHVTTLDQSNQYVPDGTYEGYQFDNGSWQYVERIFDHVYDEAPRPNPILQSRKGKNIFGKKTRH